MVQTAVQTVVFDLGGVLIDWNPRYLYRKLFDGDDGAMEHFLANVCTPAWNAQQDAGRPFAQGIRLLCAEHPALSGLITAYDERWEEMLGGALGECVALLAAVRARGIPIYALSNWSREKFRLVRPRYPFLDWFRGIVISGEEGCIKPQPEIYHCLFARYGINPATALFIDDSRENVRASESIGMPALHFTTALQLRADLSSRDVL